MSRQYKGRRIFSLINAKNVGVLSSVNKESKHIRLRAMYYSVDKKFNFYLLSMKDTPKIREIKNSEYVSFFILGIEEPYDDSWEFEANGKIELLEEEKDLKYVLKKLKGKNPFADVVLDTGIYGHFIGIKFIPNVIRFRVYKDVLNNVPPTVFKF